MKLHEGNIGQSYMVQSVMADPNITRRLQALGVNEQTRIEILNKKKSGTLMFKVRGTRLAIGCRISDGIEISEVE